MIYKNRHQAGRLWNVTFGLACLFDGLVRVLSLGFCHSTLPMEVSKHQAFAIGRRMKREREARNVS